MKGMKKAVKSPKGKPAKGKPAEAPAKAGPSALERKLADEPM